MNKIQTEDDVKQWAREIVIANGDRFTPLSKGEQFVIAKFIYNLAIDTTTPPPCEPTEDCNEPDPPKWTAHDAPDPVGLDSAKDPVNDITPPQQAQQEPQGIKMSRGAAFHFAGYSAQKAFDEFLKWSQEHPQEKEVMDFSNGQKSVVAAYSYWLHEIMNVNINPKSEN